MTDQPAPAAVAAPLSEPAEFTQGETDAIWREARIIAVMREQRKRERREDRINVLTHDILQLVQRHLAAARLTVQQLAHENDIARIEADFNAKQAAAALDAERALRQQLEVHLPRYTARPNKQNVALFRPDSAGDLVLWDDLQAALAAARGSASPDPKGSKT